MRATWKGAETHCHVEGPTVGPQMHCHVEGAGVHFSHAVAETDVHKHH